MIVLLFGPPGCGKGTQAEFVSKRFGIPAISTGEMFRAECQAGTKLGIAADAVMGKGHLVGDDVVNRMVAQRIALEDCVKGFLLDGFPRTVPQAEFLAGLLEERALPEPAVIHIEAPEHLLVERIAGRRQCPQCSRVYNLSTLPPASPGVCDLDGAKLVSRDDDHEQVIRERLRAYRELTGPVLDWYGKPLVRKVNGGPPPTHVSRAVERLLAGSNGSNGSNGSHVRAAS